MNALQLVPSCLRRLFYVGIGRGSFELELAWSEAENFAASVLPARVLPGPACLCSVFSVAGRFWLPEWSEVPQENKRMAKSQVRFRWTGNWGTGVDQHCRGPRSMPPHPVSVYHLPNSSLVFPWVFSTHLVSLAMNYCCPCFVVSLSDVSFSQLQEDSRNPFTGRTEDICCLVYHGLCHQ